MLDLRRLRVLCEVARHGSFSAAADSLGYTQPAISRQIATLEAEAGTLLVRRVPQGALLTDAGRLLVERATPLLASLDAIEVELRALAGLDGGRLRLASFASAAASIVPLAITEFRARHPQVEIEVMMADPVSSIPQLRAGELDIALSHDPIGTDASLGEAGTLPRGLEIVRLFDDPMYAALPLDHPLADEQPLGLARLADEPWMLGTTAACPDRQLFLRACREAGFEPRIAFQNDDYPAILGFVAAGVGVALVPDMVARSVRQDVVIRELEPTPTPRPISAVLPAGYCSAAAAAMLEVLRVVSERWMLDRVPLGRAEIRRAA